MESTLLHSFLWANNLKHWLAKPDCPPVIKECKILFNKIYKPKVSEDNTSKAGADDIDPVPKTIPEDLRPLLDPLQRKVVMHARLWHNGVIYATSQTHTGNSLVHFYAHGNRSSLVPGSIKYIYQDQGKYFLAIQWQLPVCDNVSDSYSIYPHFPAKLYSSGLSAQLEQVQADWILSHYARWPLSAMQVVVLSLSRVCCTFFY
jgi:hypothetical protein